MAEKPEQQPFDESNLESAEYRERLMRKLNCLIALLEVAMARVRKSLAGPDPDVERLTRIRTNLKSTLDVCIRTALERREALPKDLPATLAQVAETQRIERRERPNPEHVLRPKLDKLPENASVEMSSQAEQRKFERLGRIRQSELESVDFEDLSRKLQGL